MGIQGESKFSITKQVHQKILMAFHMVGEALDWFQDAEDNGLFTKWVSFARSLQIRFGQAAYDDPMESLTRLGQTTIEASL